MEVVICAKLYNRQQLNCIITSSTGESQHPDMLFRVAEIEIKAILKRFVGFWKCSSSEDHLVM